MTGLAVGTYSTDPEIERAQAVLASRMLGDPERPTRIGRYMMLTRVGEGAMGVVYSAHDDQLDRRVAIKLLHRAIDSPRLRRRLRREAQTLARLNHENVVQVYEIGDHRGRWFVAMQFVDGTTLRKWQADTKPSLREIVECYLQAGRGLAAAHAAGIVHRDFKPDNVLVAADRRVRVVDFGLARTEAMTTDLDKSDTEDNRPVAATLTHTGAIAGTPAYMAPEQFRGDGVGPAADQFAFCVSLFEAIVGERPFAGATRLAIFESVIKGRMRKVDAEVPAHILRALTRGLAAEPNARWPDMNALLHAIERDPSRWRRRVPVMLAVGAAIAAIPVVQTVARDRALAECAETTTLAATWNDDVRTSVSDGLLATETPYAAATADRVLPALDAYAQAWSHASADACRAALVDTPNVDRSEWCLDERRVALQATIDQLARADTETVARAVAAVAALPRIDTCRSLDLLARLPLPPANHREKVAGVRAAIVRADAIGRAGHHEEALASAQANVEAANALEWPPLAAAARNGLGQALHAAARYPEAEAELSAAYFHALEANAIEIAVAASTTLVNTVGVQLGRHADGLTWARHAETTLPRLDDPDRLATARWLERLAELRLEMFDLQEATKLAERALEIREAALGPDHPDVGDTVFLLATALNESGPLDARRKPLAQRAVEIAEASLGPDHPDLVARLDLLTLVQPAGTVPLALLDRAIELGERTLGPDHPAVAHALVGKGRAVFWQSGPDAARPILERALAIQETKLGREHPEIARTINLLGMLEHPTPRAVEYYERAIVITEKEYGPQHPFVAPPLFNLGEIALLAGDAERAARLLRRATDVRKKVWGALDGRHMGYAGRLAHYELAAGHHDRARELYELFETHAAELRSQGITDCDVHSPVMRGELELRAGDPVAARAAVGRALDLAWQCERGVEAYAGISHFGNWVLARALWDLPADAGRDRDRALRLARGALESWRALASTPRFEAWIEPCPLWCTNRDDEIARIENWLDQRT